MHDSTLLPASLYDQLRTRTPAIPVTLALIAANALVFLLMLAAGAGLWHSGNGIQLVWGANFAPATQDGQWWRLGTALFLHFGLIHVLLNLWALWDGGQLAERMFGHWRFAAIYFASGLCGNLLSLVVQGNEAVSGGASGAIFGIYGALLVYLWRERSGMDPGEFRFLFRAGSAFTVASIAFGLFVPGIDNSAHIGGLLTGILAGTTLGEAAWPRWTKAGATASLVLALGLLLLKLPEPAYRWSEEIAARAEINAFMARENRIQARLKDILRQGNKAASFEELAERIEFEITEPYEQSFERLSQLPLDNAAPSAAQIESLRAYSEQRREASQALADELRARGRFGAAATTSRALPRFAKPESANEASEK